jgi:Holliday junction resolvase RusA-like endonuclease
MKITFFIDPMGAVRMNKSDAWRKRPAVLRYRAFKDSLRVQAAPYDLPKDPLIVNLDFHIAMPDSWSKKKKALMDKTWHRQKPDKDNCEKSVTDTLWPDDDSCIAAGFTRKFWAYKGSITMEVLTYG